MYNFDFDIKEYMQLLKLTTSIKLLVEVCYGSCLVCWDDYDDDVLIVDFFDDGVEGV